MSFDMSQHLTVRELLKFTLPTMAMMLFMSAYVIADGFFVSNFCGSTALAAVNFAYPVAMILGTTGFMMGAGGGAIVSKTRGEGDEARANRQFSLFAYASIAFGLVASLVGIVALRPLMVAFGAQDEMLELSVEYGIIVCGGVPATVLQYFFQEFMVTAGKPRMGFMVTVAAGLTNIFLDWLFIVVMDIGVAGAGIGTFAGEFVGGIIPLVYFARPNSSPLRLGATHLNLRELGLALANGSSEMVSNIAASVISMAYNVQLLRYMGEAGVSAYSVISYTGLAFAGLYMGYTVGVNPLMSFQYGAGNRVEMQSIFSKSLRIIAVVGVSLVVATRLAAEPLAHIFVGYDPALEELTVHAFSIYALAFPLAGLITYGSGLFTSLGNGVISALIAFTRTLVCETGAVFLLPLVFGGDGIWWAALVADSIAFALTATLVLRFAPRYGYLPQRAS